jgi:protein-disulfide isomerase
VADKPKRPPRYDLKSAGGKSSRLVVIAGTAVIVIFAVVLVFVILNSRPEKKTPPAVTGQGDTVRVTSGKVVTQPGTADPKAVMTFYEDFLCPNCAAWEATFGPTVSKLIDIGAIAGDYSMVAILDTPRRNYSSRAGAAALCVADVSIDSFRRFHSALFSPNIQPREDARTFPDNNRLIELAREAGAAGTVPDCINSGKYVNKVAAEAQVSGVDSTPTIKLNGQDYTPASPQDLVAKIKGIVGDVPGIDAAVAPAAS